MSSMPVGSLFFFLLLFAYEILFIALAYFSGYFFNHLWKRFGHQKKKVLFLIIPILISFLIFSYPGQGWYIIYVSFYNPYFFLSTFTANPIVSAIISYFGFTFAKAEWDMKKKISIFSIFGIVPFALIFIFSPYLFFSIDGIIAALIIAAVIGAFVFTKKQKST
jgi:hypothetical protein